MQRALILPFVLAAAGGAASASQDPQHAMPPGVTHDEHLRQLQKDADLKRRGAAAMGFDQDAAAHHFRLTPDGGAIEVSVKVQSDVAGRAQVRAHLREIALAFAAGDFEKPLATHDELPPGAAAMRDRRAAIAYSYEETSGGGRVRVTTKDAAARAAIHEFLRYQIREHGTGDSEAIRR